MADLKFVISCVCVAIALVLPPVFDGASVPIKIVFGLAIPGLAAIAAMVLGCLIIQEERAKRGQY